MVRKDSKLSKHNKFVWNYLIVLVYLWFEKIRIFRKTQQVHVNPPNSVGVLVVRTDSKLLKHIEFMWNYLIVLVYKWFHMSAMCSWKFRICPLLEWANHECNGWQSNLKLWNLFDPLLEFHMNLMYMCFKSIESVRTTSRLSKPVVQGYVQCVSKLFEPLVDWVNQSYKVVVSHEFNVFRKIRIFLNHF